MSHLKSDRKKGRSSSSAYDSLQDYQSGEEVVSTPKRSKKSSVGAGKIIAVILLIVVIGTGVAGFVISPSRGQCNDIIDQFQVACNNMDITGMVSCMKPSLVTTIATVGSLAGNAVFSSETVSEFISSFVGGNYSSVSSETGMKADEMFKNIRLEPKKYGFPSKTRKVRCKASFGAISAFVDIYVTKVYGDPYIVKFRFVR